MIVGSRTNNAVMDLCQAACAGLVHIAHMNAGLLSYANYDTPVSSEREDQKMEWWTNCNSEQEREASGRLDLAQAAALATSVPSH